MEDNFGKQEILNIDSTNRLITGIATVTTAGTAVVLAADQPCKRVKIEAYEDNTGIIVFGDVNVVGAVATRRGVALFQTQGSDWLNVRNLNQLYIDSTENGDSVSFLAEI